MANNNLENRGLTVLNSDRMRMDELPTIIVAGVARSGTSMIAEVMSKLGIFLGEKTDGIVYEDVRIAKAFEADDLKEIKAIIADYDGKGVVWGFKRPEIYTRLGRYLHLFRNPRIVSVFRDPVAIAKRNEISMHADFLLNLERAIRRTEELFNFIQGIDHPAMIVSYEKALSQPAAFVDSFVEFSGLVPSPQEREAALAIIQNGPAKYLNATRIRYDGNFAGVTGRIATGVARKMPGNGVCVVEILAGDRVIGSGRAEEPHAGMKEGAKPRGFRIELTEDPGEAELTARVVDTGEVLQKTKTFSVK